MITATLSVDDYIAGHRLHLSRIRKGMYVGAALLLAVGILILNLDGKLWWGPILTCAGLGGLLGNWYEHRVRVPDKVRELYAQFKGISEPHVISWDSEIIEAKSAEASSRRKWRDYLRMREDEAVFLLYITDNLWQVFPKRWFSGEQQTAEFRRYAGQAGET